MSKLLEKTDISPLIECRRWLGWAALAGKVYGLFILVGIATPSLYQGDWYKGWLCLSAGIIVMVLSFFPANQCAVGILYPRIDAGNGTAAGIARLRSWMAANASTIGYCDRSFLPRL